MNAVTAANDNASSTAITEAEFAKRTSLHRRELHVHCYRMLASFEEAEDVLQETLLRAWDKRDSFDPSTNFRAWLYKIATNACLDVIRQKARRLPKLDAFSEIPWLQPYPDRLLDEAALAKENIELGFIAVVQLLPPKQRAILVLRDVLGFSAQEAAAAMATSVASANSALQRARATLEEKHKAGAVLARMPSDAERDLVQRFMRSHENDDADAAIKVLAEDIRVTMPPHPYHYEGLAQVSALLQQAFAPATRLGEWRLVPIFANNRPAAVSYLKKAGDSLWRAFKIDVIRAGADGLVHELTTFQGHLAKAFGLPLALTDDDLAAISSSSPHGR